ncbi:hypothetical protein AnigIFM56816_011647 [Aspergillus niger]|nr:hypothetical protein AnigIFM56816_011647 [Aspergillus niger]
MASLNSTIVHITGANQVLDFDVAKKLATDHSGYNVLMGYCDATKGDEAVAKLKIRELTVDGVMIDRAAEQVSAQFGRLDVLINNTGVISEGRSPDNTLRQTWQTGFDINTTVHVVTTQAFGPKGWKVNASDPGHCATNFNGFRGSGSPESGALQTVRLASLDKDRPTVGQSAEGDDFEVCQEQILGEREFEVNVRLIY